MKISVLFYTRTGNTRRAAELVTQGLLRIAAFDVRLMEIDAIDQTFLAESHTVLFGSPTYSSSFAWPLKQWFDEKARHCNLAGKLAGNFATGAHIGGGTDHALTGMALHELMRGMLVYSGGGPLTHLGVAMLDMENPAQQERAITFGERMGKKTLELFDSAF